MYKDCILFVYCTILYNYRLYQIYYIIGANLILGAAPYCARSMQWLRNWESPDPNEAEAYVYAHSHSKKQKWQQ